MRAVCNTSPIILLAKIRRLELLTQLYREVLIPSSVMGEIEVSPSEEAMQVRSLLQEGRFQIHEATKRALERIPADLGRGEREAIALALETKVDLVILDDQQGRRIACERGLVVTGTVGVLIEARERGLVSSVRHELDRLTETGMWINEAFYHRILQELGE